MANVDYVTVSAPPAEVLAAAEAAIAATEVVDGNVLLTGDGLTQVTVSAGSDDGSATVVDVYYGDGLADRRAVSQKIYDYIVERTDWDIELDSDDADDIIASRTRTPA